MYMKIFYAAVLLSLTASLGFGQNDRAQDAKRLMPLSEVRAGMKGVSKTVFRGNRAEEFNVEILGVAPGMIGPQQDMIVCRISGGEADRTAVFAGMSGSPVHIDGRLVGSISFAFPFSKEALCGITPIEQIISMFEDAPRKAEGRPRTFSFSELDARTWKSGADRGMGSGTLSVGSDAPTSLASVAGQTFRPIGIPLSFSGVSQRAIDMFAPQLSAAGLVPVAGAAGAAPITDLKTAGPDTLVGGTSVSVQLARGDMSLAASGTVTLRDGDKIYAFGHPFLSLGGTELPMAESSVVTVVPNLNNSFKIAVPEAMVGTLTQDRATGVFGRLGVAPALIPVRVEMTNSRGQVLSYRFEVAKDEFLTPLLINIGVANVIISNERSIGDMTIDFSGNIVVKGHDPIRIEKKFSGGAALQLASLAVALPVNSLIRSGFEDLAFDGIDVKFSVRDGSTAGTLERISVDRTEVRAGETVDVDVFIRGQGGKILRERVPVTIPSDAQPGKLTLTISDGGDIQQALNAMQFTPRSLGELVALIRRAKKEDRLYVQLTRAASGAVIGATELPDLPPSILATMGSDRNAGMFKPMTQSLILEQELPPAAFVVNGKQMVGITVVSRQ